MTEAIVHAFAIIGAVTVGWLFVYGLACFLNDL